MHNWLIYLWLAPAQEASVYEIQKFNIPIAEPNVYMRLPGPEVDKAWEDLYNG